MHSPLILLGSQVQAQLPMVPNETQLLHGPNGSCAAVCLFLASVYSAPVTLVTRLDQALPASELCLLLEDQLPPFLGLTLLILES